jgi:lipoprotein-anchoring transpeptidase ErfK/SrfK
MVCRALLLISLVAASFADVAYDPYAPSKPLRYEVVPYGKTYFKRIDNKTGRASFHDMTERDFIVVSVREEGSDGRFYAVDRDGTVWLSGPVSSGVPQYRTPSGIFRIYKKSRYHMSRRYPDEHGVNNMDFALWFYDGYALHKGDVDWMSHGCIHVAPRDIGALYRWAKVGMPVIVTRHSYMPFARGDLRRIYGTTQ